MLQTYFPDHYAVQFAAHHDFEGFYEKELRFRGWMHYPPFTSVANVMVRSDQQEDALRYSGILGKWFEGRCGTRACASWGRPRRPSFV